VKGLDRGLGERFEGGEWKCTSLRKFGKGTFANRLKLELNRCARKREL